MMEYGQPMHAFDFACVDGGHIIVRTAREGEVCRTLSGTPRNVTPSMLCICDEHKPVGLAGVMGGENSEITADTKMVLFESANFNGTSIRRTAAALNMRTDASAHYEEGLDPYLTRLAVDRACELVELLGAGEVIDGVIDVFPDPPKPLVRELDVDRVNWILGTDISGDTCAASSLTSASISRGTRSPSPAGGSTSREVHAERFRRGDSPHLRLRQHPGHHDGRLRHRGRRLHARADGRARPRRRLPRLRIRRDNHLLLLQPLRLGYDYASRPTTRGATRYASSTPWARTRAVSAPRRCPASSRCSRATI